MAGEEEDVKGERVVEEVGLVVVVAELGLDLLEWDGGVVMYWVWGEDEDEVDIV